MVIESTEYCGLSNLLPGLRPDFAPLARSVVYSGCINTYSHIHEIGHTMGLQHDRGNAVALTDFSYGFGFRYCGPTNAFRSIMAYPCDSSTRVPLFSSPNVTYHRTATGNAQNNNVRVLQQTHVVVANFMSGPGSGPRH